jgi:hypothetical protein
MVNCQLSAVSGHDVVAWNEIDDQSQALAIDNRLLTVDS